MTISCTSLKPKPQLSQPGAQHRTHSHVTRMLVTEGLVGGFLRIRIQDIVDFFSKFTLARRQILNINDKTRATCETDLSGESLTKLSTPSQFPAPYRQCIQMEFSQEESVYIHMLRD